MTKAVSDPDFEGFDLEVDEETIPIRHRQANQAAPVYTGIPDLRMGIVQSILYKKIHPSLLDEEDERQFALNLADVLLKYFFLIAAFGFLSVINFALLVVILIAIF